jgi:stearoyl-CoA desaturase (delta-9 desaturase)
VHLAAPLALLLDFRWWYPLLTLGLYYAGMFFITAGFHRYFSHRSYRTSRAFQFLLALGGTMTTQKGVLWWAGSHRHHHKYSDQPEDLHSPLQRGFWWSHMGWILSVRNKETPVAWIRDFECYPELRWLDRNYLLPPVALAALLFAAGGLPVVTWGYFVMTTVLWHGTFTINSLSHVFGSRRYRTTDTSRNNWLLALITMGEGWHNNHHHYQSTANQGFYWWEIDFSYYLLRLLSWLGLVWDLRTPPRHIRDAEHEPVNLPAAAPDIAA